MQTQTCAQRGHTRARSRCRLPASDGNLVSACCIRWILPFWARLPFEAVGMGAGAGAAEWQGGRGGRGARVPGVPGRPGCRGAGAGAAGWPDPPQHPQKARVVRQVRHISESPRVFGGFLCQRSDNRARLTLGVPALVYRAVVRMCHTGRGEAWALPMRQTSEPIERSRR